MKVIDNPQLSRLMLDHLTGLYKLSQKREGVHLSTLIYCLTKSFLDNQHQVDPTDEEVMLFSLGLGLQDEFTPKEAAAAVVYEEDGITFSPDITLHLHSERPTEYVEMKTTRISSEKGSFPDSWVEYMMGGCFMRKVNTYDLSVLHMMGNYKPPFPVIKSYRLEFTDDELFDNWDYITHRRDVYCEALKIGKAPTPGEWCKDWECKNCRFKIQCDALLVLKEFE